ncbi:amidohydrolase family protein [uncultured Shimia sp.]|uniref:amidohydrolase n=1 Tax=uncultured Shimia sp. TaxID=573152 RepID=UPI002626C13A|nr:amidohydrolase family protein [uncultured Shimia sp.]
MKHFLFSTAIASLLATSAMAQEITIFTAQKIITMEDTQPEATAVAVDLDAGRIVSVGSLHSLSDYVDDQQSNIDRQFDDKILMPGFIDPHVHPSLPAVLSQFPFLAPDDWYLPTGDFPGATTHEAYVARLQELVTDYQTNNTDPAIPFIAWGYHQLWHGDVKRPLLTELFPDTPVILWHRSFHEVIMNDAAIELLAVTQSDVEKYAHETNWEGGHFWENGAKILIGKMPFLFAPERYAKGMENFLEMMHQGGVTTALDMGVGIFGDPVGETALIRQVANTLQPPARIILTPIITDFLARGKTPEEALEEIQQWTALSTSRVLFDNHFKLMMDGAIFSGLSQYGFPGYKDGHEGLWMAPLEVTEEWGRFFWNAGFQLHAHTNGDLSAKELIRMVRSYQAETPRSDHRTVLEHFAFAHEDQLRQMAALGIAVSANPYYQYILADIYAERWLGADIARNMVPLGSAKGQGVVSALHSDAPMAPLQPLVLAETAVMRTSINGNQNNPAEALDRHDALRGITIDAAWIINREDDVGSIRAGKKADFVVLEADPYTVAADQLGEIEIWGTVFEGQVYPVK